MKKYFLLSLGVLTLAGCERPAAKLQHGLPMPVQTFAHIEPLAVAVDDVDIVVGDGVTKTYIGDYSVALDERAVLYFSKKLEAMSTYTGQRRLSVIIDATDVEHVQKDSQHKVFEKIGVDHVDQYTMRLAVRLEHQDLLTGDVIYGRKLNVSKTYSVSEHDSPVTREQKRFDAIEAMFDILDPEVNRVVRNEMNL